jgi:hypothetical protein
MREVTLRFAWAPASGRVKAAYRSEVLRHEPDGDRYICRLAELIEIERSAAEEVGDDTLRGLIGKCVRVPGEALNGMTLPLKMFTLTEARARPYFFDSE